MIYLVEDDESIRELVVYTLKSQGMDAKGFERPSLFWKELEKEVPALILLDIMLPEEDGISILRKLRTRPDTRKIPVIMLTAKGETADRVSGLEMGADDYIVKPLEMPEVIARVRAVFRRIAPDDAPEKLSFDNLVIDKQAYDLVIKGKRVDAPPKEIELLYFLASSPNRVFTRAQLLDEVWGFDYFGDTRTVDVHVKRLREKLEGVSDKWELKTVWGVGYKFETKE